MSETVVFFGSGPVAQASLEYLVRHFVIEAVVTKPTTLREMAQTAPGSVIRSVKNTHELTKLIAKKPFKSRLGVLVDFGIIVEQNVIDYFPLGIINSHFSLLPEWRGADPISFAILSGQEKTGVSLMLIAPKLDEGALLAQSVIKIEPSMTTPQLTGELVDMSNEMFREILPLYVGGQLIPYEQPRDQEPTYSRRLHKADGILDWSKTATQLEREIRAFIDWPKSRTQLAGKDVIITKAKPITLQGVPGNTTIVDKKVVVFCAENALMIEKLKPAGKKEMSSEAFLSGYTLNS